MKVLSLSLVTLMACTGKSTDTADTAVAVAQAEQEDSEPVDEVTPEPEETTDETNQ